MIKRGDNLPIVDLTKYNTDGKEAKYIQIHHTVGKLTTNKKTTEDHIKKAEFPARKKRETTSEGYQTAFDKLSIRWGLIFVDDQIVVPIDLRRRLLGILHFGHSGTTEMTSEAKIFWWPGMNQDIENKVKDCTACLASGKNLKYQN